MPTAKQWKALVDERDAMITQLTQMLDHTLDMAKEQNELMQMLQDGIKNRGWKIVKPDDGDNGGGGKKPAPITPQPSGTDVGYAVIKEILDGFSQKHTA